MAKLDIRGLNYMTCGTKQNSFNITYAYTDDNHIMTSKPKSLSVVHTNTFFGDVGTDESMSQRYATNKSAFYDMNNKIVIHNLYNLNKVKLQDSDYKYNSAKCVDMYVPYISDDFINCCQVKNYAYALSRELSTQPMTKTIYFDQTPECQYRYVLSSQDLHTYLYNALADLSTAEQMSTYNMYISANVSAEPMLSNYYLSSIFDIKRVMNTLDYNYFIEFPNSTVQNTYKNGEIKCNFALTKNPYDIDYNMNVESSFSVIGSRQYCGIDYCGGLLYLRFRDNVKYSVASTDISHEKDKFAADKIQLSMKKEQPKDSYTYQHIEVIKSFDQFDASDSSTGHKSTLFSVRLNDIGLNKSTLDETVKAKLRQTITNNIQKMAEKICPAHTQLFKVYFEGK